MAISVTNTTQLSTFSTIQTILLNNSTLSKKFTKRDILEFEPSIESVGFNDFPYIVINVPSTDTDPLTLNRQTTIKTFTVTIVLAMSWEAKDNFTSYANAIIKQVEASESTFESSGYYNQNIDMIDTTVDSINGRPAVVGTFELTMYGTVCR